MSDFTALRAINAPNSYARAYNPGDPVVQQVVTDWHLVVGEDVEPTGGAHARPAEDSDDRTAWEAYVVGMGTNVAAARAASLDELRGMYDPPPPPEPAAHDLPANAAPEGVDGAGWQNPTPVSPDNVPSPAPDAPDENLPERPAESARKAEWVEWAVASGADEEWARSDDTTKADLIAWKL